MSSPNMMTTTPNCPNCGASLPADAPQGLCPRCLLQTEAATQTDADPTPAAAGSPAAPAPSVEEIGRHFPQLEVLELIGQGGMGIVYKARQPKLDRPVALKILPAEVGSQPAFAERFAREARTLARLNHPGIVAIYDFGQAGPYFYLVLEYVEGADVRRLLRTQRLQPAEVLPLVSQVCDALQFAHNQGVVHRDIKPGNILVDRSGRVKIADFGLAKLLGQDTGEDALTGSHHVMGTLNYMAPEQRERPKDVDHRADIYSLGVVFYEMLTGDLPIGPFPPPSQKVRLDVRLDEVVLRALEREPERRYQQAGEVKTRVQCIAADPNPAPPQAPRRRWPEWLRPTRGRALAAGLGLGLCLAGATAVLWPPAVQAVLRESPPGFGHATANSRWLNYRADIPANHRLSVWLEWLEHGQVVERPDFALEESVVTARNRPLHGELTLVIWDDPLLPGHPTNRVAWNWGVRADQLLVDARQHALDPFEGMTLRDSSYGHAPVRHLRPGQSVTLAVLRGDRKELSGQPWDASPARRAEVEMRLHARLDPVAESQLGDLPQQRPARAH